MGPMGLGWLGMVGMVGILEDLSDFHCVLWALRRHQKGLHRCICSSFCSLEGYWLVIEINIIFGSVSQKMSLWHLVTISSCEELVGPLKRLWTQRTALCFGASGVSTDCSRTEHDFDTASKYQSFAELWGCCAITTCRHSSSIHRQYQTWKLEEASSSHFAQLARQHQLSEVSMGPLGASVGLKHGIDHGESFPLDWIILCRYIYIYTTYVYLSICLSVCLSVRLSVRLSISPSLRLSVSPSLRLSVSLSLSLSVSLSLCLSVSLSLCLSVCLSVYFHVRTVQPCVYPGYPWQTSILCQWSHSSWLYPRFFQKGTLWGHHFTPVL